MSLNSPTPLPTTSGIARTEIGGWALAGYPPDRYSDHLGVDVVRYCILQWVDNKEKKSKEVMVSLGKTGNASFIRIRNGMGQYRSRQFIIKFTDACLFELTTMEDDFKVTK